MRALVVDDSKVMRRVVTGALRRAGLENVHEAIDGVEAVDAVKRTSYAIVMMDCNMPNMDGLEAIRTIRESGATMPIIMVTTENDKRRVLEAIRAGATGFITKPFSSDTIVSKIKRTLASLDPHPG